MTGDDSRGGAVSSTQHEEVRALLILREAQLAETQRLARIGSWSWCASTGQMTWTDEMYRLFGVERSPFTATFDAALALVRPDHRARATELVETCVRDRVPIDVCLPVVPPRGDARWLRIRATAQPDPRTGFVVVRGTAQLTEDAGEQAPADFDGLHDPITGLATRTLLENRAARALARARRHGWDTALIVLNIDHFHEINDQHGIEVGDEVLVEVARRLAGLFRVNDSVSHVAGTVGRLGGDEFVVLCEHVDRALGTTVLAERVQSALQEPIPTRRAHLAVTASVGVAVSAPGELRLGELFLHADAARRQAKRGGLGQWHVFGMDTAGGPAVDADGLYEALERGQFRLVYQPKVDLATDRMSGTEALLRWDHPERGVVPPLEFIPLAEESGLIVPIGSWVIEEACRQIARWDDSLPGRGLVTSVNVSARQFGADLVGTVSRALAATGVRPSSLCLEVTESVVMNDVDAAIVTLGSLADLGVRLSVDDFGTGYSSLAYLKRFPIHEVKIDKSFIDGLGANSDDTAIVAAIMGMSHALRLAVVAEGVETAEQVQQLRTLGCEYVQGYYFSPPIPAADIPSLLTTEGPTTTAPSVGAPRADRVLVVDDAPDVRMLSRMSLTAAGFEVHEAENGTRALTLAHDIAPDCVVLDLLMPDMTGLEVCRALRADPTTADATILMLTGNADAADKVLAFGSGVDDYIVKPFSPRDLVSRVHAAMRHRKGTAGAGSP